MHGWPNEFQWEAWSQMTCAKEYSHSRCIHDSVGLEVEAMLCLEASSMVVKSSFHFFILFLFLFLFLWTSIVFTWKQKLWDFLQLINSENSRTTSRISSPPQLRQRIFMFWRGLSTNPSDGNSWVNVFFIYCLFFPFRMRFKRYESIRD